MMKYQSRLFAYLTALVFLALQGISTAWASTTPASSPKEVVETTTRDLLNTFQKNIASYQKDPDSFISVVDKELSPIVSFNSIARGVMGKYAHRSKPEQIQQFSGVFKHSLISFYGKALLKLDDHSLTIEKVDDVPQRTLSNYSAGKIRLIPVNMQVKTSKRTVAISYSMEKVNGQWKMRNVIVDGINIGKQFRNQFADAMEKHGKVQYVIDHWQEIMKGNNKEKKAS